MTHLYGSLMIDAQSSTPPLPIFDDVRTVRGRHTTSPNRGQWALLPHYGSAQIEIPIPARERVLEVTTCAAGGYSEAVSTSLEPRIRDLDNKYPGSRWLYKLKRLQDDFVYAGAYAVVVHDRSEHPSFSILSSGVDIGFYGVYDTVNRSVQLVWTTDPDFVQRTRATEPTRYLFHRYPVIRDRPLFLHTENICSKWYVWKQAFTNVDGVLKAFNVLENFLFKNPEIAEFRR